MKIILIFIIVFSCNLSFASTCKTDESQFGANEGGILDIYPKDFFSTKKALYTIKLDRTSLSEKRRAFNDDEWFDFKNINLLSIYKNETNPFTFDLVFHGKSDFLIALTQVDFRAFFYKRLPRSNDEKMDQIKVLQSHLGEYERRAVVFRRQLGRSFSKTKNTKELANEIKFSLKKTAFPLTGFVFTNNCRGIGSFEYEWPGYLKGYVQLPTTFIDSLYKAFDQTSNCEPIGVDKNQSEIRLTKFYSEHLQEKFTSSSLKDFFVSLWSKYFDEYYEWIRLGNFEKISPKIDIVKMKLLPSSMNYTEVEIKHANGKIPYDEYTGETQFKSGYNRMGEPLSYLKTACKNKKPIPYSFEIHEAFVQTPLNDFWENTCYVVPYTFRTWEDLISYQAHLAKFEVDGVYTGRTLKHTYGELKGHNKLIIEKDKDRMPFSFAEFIADYNKAKVSINNDLLTIDLQNSKGVNLILGNIPLSKLIESEQQQKMPTGFYQDFRTHHLVKGMESLVGISPRPLSYQYANVKEIEHTTSFPFFSLFYDAQSGQVLNHHDRKIGIEQWILRYKKDHLVLDLVSHERIVPLRRLLIPFETGQ